MGTCSTDHSGVNADTACPAVPLRTVAAGRGAVERGAEPVRADGGDASLLPLQPTEQTLTPRHAYRAADGARCYFPQVSRPLSSALVRSPGQRVSLNQSVTGAGSVVTVVHLPAS